MTNQALYVAVGSSGLVKVGRTSSPATRKIALCRDFRLMGEEIISFEVTEFIPSYIGQEEKELIDFAKSLDGAEAAFGREFWRGIDAGKCFKKANEIAAASIERWKGIHERREADRAKWREQSRKREANKAKKLDELKQKHFSEFTQLQKDGLLPLPVVEAK